MLASLRIKNLALIDELLWEPGPGFNSLTGETGAGKSILIDALMLLAGERADKSLVRTGETACAVEAGLELAPGPLRRVAAVLEEIGAEPCEGNALLLKRTVTVSGASGVSRQFVNGSPVTLQALKQLGDLLVDVHGPHDHQSLLHTEAQLRVLDACGKTAPLRDGVRKVYDGWQELVARREALTLSEKEREDRLERLRRHASEIADAKLQPDEDLHVDREFRLAHNSRQILEWASALIEQISEGEGAVITQLAHIEKTLVAWQKLDPEIAAWSELNHGAIAQLQELAETARAYSERVELDPAQLAKLEDRMALLHGLKKKYGPMLADVLAHGAEAAAELQALESSDASLAELEKQEVAARKELHTLAEKLTAARRKTAQPLAESITGELRELGFKQAAFSIDLKAKPESAIGRGGADDIEFIFAPNVGEAPRPLRAIASSGEMARVMLAIKTTLAEVDEVPILIFDEVDANVGGETAWAVGRKLGKLGKSHQVLCVTHQPQVAAQGDPHFHVAKSVRDGRTATKLDRLDHPARLRELARMLGGENKESLALAEKMVEGKGK